MTASTGVDGANRRKSPATSKARSVDTATREFTRPAKPLQLVEGSGGIVVSSAWRCSPPASAVPVSVIGIGPYVQSVSVVVLPPNEYERASSSNPVGSKTTVPSAATCPVIGAVWRSRYFTCTMPTIPVSTSNVPLGNQNELGPMPPVIGSKAPPVSRVPLGKVVDGLVPTSMWPVAGRPSGGGATVKVAVVEEGVSTPR